MAAIAGGDVTVTRTESWIEGKKRHVRGTITFGNGSLTYSTAGIPLGTSKADTLAKFGMYRQLDTLEIFGINERTTDYVVRYGPANRTLLMYEEEAAAAAGPLLECDTSEAPAARTYSYHAIGW